MIVQAGELMLLSAEQHLAIRDTAGALARLAEIEKPFTDRHFQYVVTRSYGPPLWSGRAWLLAGDIAAARGQLDEARRMYRRAIGLWEGGDPDVMPVVERARTRLASLSGR